MKRKIVQHGSSSLTITLPSKWITKFNLKKGDELDVEELDTQVIYSTGKAVNTTTKEIDISQFGIFTKNNLSHLYQVGYDEIMLHNVDSETLRQIEDRITDCMGYVIIEQKPGVLHIKSIANTMEEEFDTLLKKSFQITNDMAKEMQQALQQQKISRLTEIRKMEKLNNRFTDICIRILNKRGYKKRTMQMYEIIKNIERIADEFKHICDSLQSCKKISPELIKIFNAAAEFYLLFYEIFYKNDHKKEVKFLELQKEIQKKIELQFSNSKKEELIALYHCANIVQKTYDGMGGYYALIL